MKPRHLRADPHDWMLQPPRALPAPAADAPPFVADPDAPLHPADNVASGPSVFDAATVPVRKRWDGWTAERQRIFLTVLAETGSIGEACTKAGVSSRSAYRLRARPDAAPFARAWDEALKLATARLTALAFERATMGTVREIWRDGELVGQVRQPSDKLLMFLLAHLLPAGRPGERWAGFETMSAATRTSFPATLAALTDTEMEMVEVESRDFFPDAPGDPREDG